MPLLTDIEKTATAQRISGALHSLAQRFDGFTKYDYSTLIEKAEREKNHLLLMAATLERDFRTNDDNLDELNREIDKLQRLIGNTKA